MSYIGYTGVISAYCSMIKDPRILEVGVDRGQTLLPLVHNVGLLSRNFKYVGIDVRQDITLLEQLQAMKIPLYHNTEESKQGMMSFNKNSEWNVAYIINNSLTILPMLEGLKFDVIMIDGDHNYATVSKELKYVEKLCYDSTIIVIDDYNGRWSVKDLHYSERETHEGNDFLEKTDDIKGKTGVKTAVDDWLKESPHWKMITIPEHEPAILTKNHVNLSLKTNSPWLYDSGLYYESQLGLGRFVEDAATPLSQGKPLAVDFIP